MYQIFFETARDKNFQPDNRQTMFRLMRVQPVRSFTTTRPSSFLSLFGRNDLKKRQEIVEKQNDFEADVEKKIVILNEENSPSYKKFDPEVDMPDFEVAQWKENKIHAKDVESTYSQEDVANIINSTYQSVAGKPVTLSDYNNTDLHDLTFRFNFAKSLQLKLGFDISDYALSKSHNLSILYDEENKIVSKRWVNERNPNGIVLSPDDFADAKNLYLNQELSAKQQKERLQDLVKKASNEEV